MHRETSSPARNACFVCADFPIPTENSRASPATATAPRRKSM